MAEDGVLTGLLDKIAPEEGKDKVKVQELVERIGSNAFPALMLVPALIVASPASGIPGLSSVGGLTIAVIAAQYVFGRKSVWLPRFLSERSLPAKRLDQAVNFLRKPGGWIDKVLKPRLTFLAKKPFSLVLASVVVLLGLVMPALELVPFSSSLMAGVISFISLSLLFRDGVLALIAATLLFGGGYLIYANFLA